MESAEEGNWHCDTCEGKDFKGGWNERVYLSLDEVRVRVVDRNSFLGMPVMAEIFSNCILIIIESPSLSYTNLNDRNEWQELSCKPLS